MRTTFLVFGTAFLATVAIGVLPSAEANAQEDPPETLCPTDCVPDPECEVDPHAGQCYTVACLESLGSEGGTALLNCAYDAECEKCVTSYQFAIDTSKCGAPLPSYIWDDPDFGTLGGGIGSHVTPEKRLYAFCPGSNAAYFSVWADPADMTTQPATTVATFQFTCDCE